MAYDTLPPLHTSLYLEVPEATSAPGGHPGDAAGYQRDGYMVTTSAVDAATVSACRSHLLRVQASRPAGTSILAVVPGTDPFLEAMAADSRLAGLAARLLGGPVVCFGCTFMVKRGGGGPPALWHQDGHPWAEKLGVKEAVTLWLALDEVTAANGALLVIPGSHWLPAQPLVPVEGGAGGMFGAAMDAGRLESVLETARPPRLLEMAAGDVSAHHPWLVHASGANRCPTDRRALVLRYRPDPGSAAGAARPLP